MLLGSMHAPAGYISYPLSCCIGYIIGHAELSSVEYPENGCDVLRLYESLFKSMEDLRLCRFFVYIPARSYPANPKYRESVD